MAWQDQGRQEHGWFGNGTSAAGADLIDPANSDDIIRAVANSVIGYLPRDARRHSSAAFTPSMVNNLQTAVAAWNAASGLSHDEFKERYLTPATSDATVDLLRSASEAIGSARTQQNVVTAAAVLATAMTRISLDQWPRYLATVADRALEKAGSPEIRNSIAGPALTDGRPVPVILADGTMVRSPVTDAPLLRPAAASLVENVKTGKNMELLSVDHTFEPLMREEAMALQFGWYMPMDYQDVYRYGNKYNRNFIDFGNYNFGAVAAAAGYDYQSTLRGAGLYNRLGSGRKDGPYHSNPDNNIWIRLGYDDYLSGKILR